MHASAEFLWRLNRDYVNRLVKARNTLGLLEHILLTRADADAQTRLLPSIQFTRSILSQLSDAHRDWCYDYFYESAETKRMVQSSRGVRLALSGFDLMREQYASLLEELAERLDVLPPPAADLMNLPHGDLWQMAQYSLHALAEIRPSTR